MQDPEAQEIMELLGLASDVKTRLRQLESQASTPTNVGTGASKPNAPEAATFGRARNHLELALEALGSPTWGFAGAPASSIEITGFYSSDIYKALKDLREAKGRGGNGKSSTVRNAVPKKERRQAKRSGRRRSDEEAEALAQSTKRDVDGAPLETPIATEGEAAVDQKTSSVWVQSRVDEIQRALTAAFGDDELLPDFEAPPKPFASPEFIGNTDTLSVPELVGFFQLQGKTGVLTIDARQEQFKLEYLRGELIHAGSSSSPDGHRLGEVLVRLGHVTEAKLNGLLVGKSDAERLGDALRRGDIVSEDALAQALEYQVQNIFHRLFDLGGCRFTFREGLEGEPRARVRYNVTRLLLETARHRDEQRQAG